MGATFPKRRPHHTTHLIEDDHLVAASGQRDARLRERLDLVAHDVDSTAIRYNKLIIS